MKYLKTYESLFKEITDNEYINRIEVDMQQRNIDYFLNVLSNLEPVTGYSNLYAKKNIKFTIDEFKKYTIYEIDDEYFLVKYCDKSYNMNHYLCDGTEGVIELLKKLNVI